LTYKTGLPILTSNKSKLLLKEIAVGTAALFPYYL